MVADQSLCFFSLTGELVKAIDSGFITACVACEERVYRYSFGLEATFEQRIKIKDTD